MMKVRQAIGVIMGANIGTTVTAMLSSVGTNKNARRAAVSNEQRAARLRSLHI